MPRTHERRFGPCRDLSSTFTVGPGFDSRHDAAGSRARQPARELVIGRPIDTDGRAGVRSIDNDLHSRSNEWPQNRLQNAERPLK